MKNIKKIIPILIIFLTIGFAAVNYTLSLDGDANLTGDLEEFKVYFSRVLINGVEDNSIVSSTTQLDFSNKLTNIGQEYVVDYDITNASKYFDASITLSCTEGNEYLSVTNTFDTSNLTSLETRTGKLVLKRLKSLASNDSQFTKITCTINAQPIERETLGEGTITNPVNPYYIGREVSIGTEKFNIISEQENTITMLAKNNILTSTPYNQTEEQMWTPFSNSNGWEYTPGPKDIEIQNYNGSAKTLINYYTNYIKKEYNIDTTSNLITLNELAALGCKTPSNYAFSTGGWTCNNSPHIEWISNGQVWWTRSAVADVADAVWFVGGTGYISQDQRYTYGVRPTITISKKTAQLLLKTYRIGQEISIGDELFNVISDNGTTISMLAQYNLGTNYRQSKATNNVNFSNESGWEWTPRPKEIDIQTWSTNPKTYINAYVSYLKEVVSHNSLTGDLISLKQLSSLGCIIPTDYSWDDNKRSCSNSLHKNWLINNQNSWTKSSNYDSVIWIMHFNKDIVKNLDTNYYYGSNGVRPVITISKEALEPIK